MSLIGNQLTSAVTQPETSYRVFVVGDTSSTTTGAELIYRYRIAKGSALSFLPAPATTSSATYGGLPYRESRITDDADGLTSLVEVIYRSDNAADGGGGGGGGLSPGSVLKQLDVGVITQPIELHPYFTGTSGGAALTAREIHDARNIINGSDVTDNGTTLTYMLQGTEYPLPVSLTGKPRELALYKLYGVESYYIPAPIFRLTKGHTSVSFASFGAIGQREYPGYSLPGTTTEWLKTAFRADDRGSVESSVEEWTYSKDGWDTLFGHLYQ